MLTLSRLSYGAFYCFHFTVYHSTKLFPVSFFLFLENFVLKVFVLVTKRVFIRNRVRSVGLCNRITFYVPILNNCKV